MKVVVVAPHPDDETLGCGGALLRHAAEGDQISWLIVTGMHAEQGYSAEMVLKREREIEQVAAAYGFTETECLGYPTTMLDTLPVKDLVAGIGAEFSKLRPEIVYCPHSGDAHSDHAAVYKAVESCSKWFRFESVKKVYIYETLSETDQSFETGSSQFAPNVYVNIEEHLERKIEILGLYQGETASFPFPRSDLTIRSLARLRGSSSGFHAAEAFMLVRERI